MDMHKIQIGQIPPTVTDLNPHIPGHIDDYNLSENSPPTNTSNTTFGTNNSSPKNINLNSRSASVSYIRASKDTDTFSMLPLHVDDIPSSNATPKKQRRSRSNSARLTPYKYEILKKKCKTQANKLQMYEDKITNIQDVAEETEQEIKRRYELKLLHLETKYLREKSEKTSLQQEVSKLKQNLATIVTRSPNPPSPHPMLNRYASSSTVVVHPDGTPTGRMYDISHNPRSPFDISSIGRVSVDSFNADMKRVKRKRTVSSKKAYSSPYTYASSTSGESSDTESDSTTETESTSDSSDSISIATDDSSDTTSEDELIYSKSHGRKSKRKRKKPIESTLNEEIQKTQPKGFWGKIWSLFGPPDLVCGCK